MKSFFQHALWVGLAGLFAMAVVSLIPPTASSIYSYVRGYAPNPGLSYQAAAAALPTAPTVKATVNILDPVFTPPPTGKVIRADLSAMKISLYEDGEEVATYNILAKGRPGTAWET
ncbi:MAG: hypothetical protein Q7T49_02150, partial [bacterium]|nr:hypothetical protein [bacterium]